jgi:hypothetical protein
VQQGFAAQALQRGWQRIAADQSPEQVGAACRQALQQRFGA